MLKLSPISNTRARAGVAALLAYVNAPCEDSLLCNIAVKTARSCSRHWQQMKKHSSQKYFYFLAFPEIYSSKSNRFVLEMLLE